MADVPRHLKQAAKAARGAGWTVEPTRNGHWKFTPPDKSLPPIITGSTPSDGRALRNFRADLKRAGLEI
jgi:hypothetical protein